MEPDIQVVAGGDGVSVHAGFPNPALDQRGRSQALALDINRLLVRRPSSTYLFRVGGHNWARQGIYDGDLAVIDRALAARDGDLVIVWQDSGFLIARQRYLPDEAHVWGVVTAVIHQFKKH